MLDGERAGGDELGGRPRLAAIPSGASRRRSSSSPARPTTASADPRRAARSLAGPAGWRSCRRRHRGRERQRRSALTDGRRGGGRRRRACAGVETRARRRTRRSPGPRSARGCARTGRGPRRRSGPTAVGEQGDAGARRRGRAPRQRAISKRISSTNAGVHRRSVRSTPKRRRSSCGTYCRPRSRSSSMSRRKLVSWNASPSAPRRAHAPPRVDAARGSAASSRRSPPPSRPCSRAGRRRSRSGRPYRSIVHRSQEPAERVGVDVEGPHGVHDGLEHEIVRPARGRDRRRSARRSRFRAA